MGKRPMTPFGKAIRHRLIDMEQRPSWLIERVREDTGLYFDSSYLYKIQTGQVATPSIVGSIRKLLDIKE